MIREAPSISDAVLNCTKLGLLADAIPNRLDKNLFLWLFGHTVYISMMSYDVIA